MRRPQNRRCGEEKVDDDVDVDEERIAQDAASADDEGE